MDTVSCRGQRAYLCVIEISLKYLEEKLIIYPRYKEFGRPSYTQKRWGGKISHATWRVMEDCMISEKEHGD